MPEGSGGSDAPLHVVATAGHVDHGKSSLIVRLTGIDPDRLAEEQQRGLTIDLGFAWCALPSGREIGFVDVPGHERFVRNMLAGGGIGELGEARAAMGRAAPAPDESGRPRLFVDRVFTISGAGTVVTGTLI